MKLHYYKDPVGNFGDDLNPIIWDSLLPDVWDDDPSTMLVGIGTILNQEVPREGRKLVFGSGAGYGRLPEIDANWTFYSVRGPLTAGRLGLDPSLAIADPALLAAYIGLPPVAQDHSVAFMPHHKSVGHADWRGVCQAAGIVYLDPQAPAAETLNSLRRSRLVIAEAMHGAILADAFRIPWVPVVCYDHILDFKWRDWCQSHCLDYRPLRLPSLWQAAPAASLGDRFKSEVKHALRRSGVWSDTWGAPIPRASSAQDFDAAATALSNLQQGPSFLSDETVHKELASRLMDKLDLLRRDLAPLRATA